MLDIMSNYRTQSLFHYTSKASNLLEIIKSGVLYPNFCKEDLSTKRHPNYILGIPEICFCDIPISMADNFLESYGKYAIAFDKKWGINNGCNPLLYVANDTIIDGAIHYRERLKALHKYVANRVAIEGAGHYFNEMLNYLDDNKAYMYSLGFLKKYMGEWRGKPYCNYDENEWRYILEDGYFDIWWKDADELKEWRGKTSDKPEPTEDMKTLGLKFTSNDIKHIILNTESEIPQFIDDISAIGSIGGQVITGQEKSILISKVASFERISQDF